MHTMNLSKPFDLLFQSDPADQLFHLVGRFLSYMPGSLPKIFSNTDLITDGLHQFWEDSQAFILMGAVIYIIAAIFKRGVDIQSENDLTV